MKKNNLVNINKLIEKEKFDEAQIELSKLDPKYHKNPEYLYLRSKIFFSNKLYYIAIDTLLVALEFEESDKVYNLLAKIYNLLDNKMLSKKILDLNLRRETVNLLKNELSGIYRREL